MAAVKYIPPCLRFIQRFLSVLSTIAPVSEICHARNEQNTEPAADDNGPH